MNQVGSVAMTPAGLVATAAGGSTVARGHLNGQPTCK